MACDVVLYVQTEGEQKTSWEIADLQSEAKGRRCHCTIAKHRPWPAFPDHLNDNFYRDRVSSLMRQVHNVKRKWLLMGNAGTHDTPGKRVSNKKTQ